jgi:AcrR family transcriptional regulator
MAALVEAAVAEFLEAGYQGASMERIARRAGVTKGGLYHHFPGKDALFLYANQALAEPIARLLSDAQRAPSPSEGLGRYIERTLGFWAKRPRQMEFSLLTMTKLGQLPQARQAYALAYRETLGVLTLLYRRGLEVGELSGLTAEESALGLVAALDGALGMMLVDPKRTASTLAASLRGLFVERFQVRRKLGLQRR